MTPDLADLDFVGATTQTAYGRTFYNVSRGDTTNSVTLFLHGVSATSHIWAPLLLAARQCHIPLGNCLIADLPGFGKSENCLDSLSMHDTGRMLIDLCEHLGFHQIRLVGHSMGGFLALDMASRFPDRVTSVHVAAGSYLTVLATIQHPWRQLILAPKIAIVWDLYWLTCLFGGLGIYRIASSHQGDALKFLLIPFVLNFRKFPADLSSFVLRNISPRPLVLAAQNGANYDPARTWSNIVAPLNLVYGDHDRLISRKDQLEMMRIVPKANISQVNAGHLLILERPVETLYALGLNPQGHV